MRFFYFFVDFLRNTRYNRSIEVINMNNVTANRMKERRIELGITLKELEDLTGISRSTLNRYEQGLSMLTIDKVKRLSEALSVSQAYLMGWESKAVSYEEINLILAIVNGLNGEMEYDANQDLYYLRLNQTEYTLSPKKLSSLNEMVQSYFNFCLNNI